MLEDRVRADLEGSEQDSGASRPHAASDGSQNESINDLNDRVAFGATANSDAQLQAGLRSGNNLEPIVEESPLRSLVSEIENKYR